MMGYVQRLLLSVWLGQMVFMAGVLAPRVFRVLERADAAKLQNAIFPVYYLVGMLAGGLLLVLSLISKSRMKSLFAWRYWVPIVFLALGTGLFAYSYFVLTPAIANLSAQGLGQSAEFGQLHQWSVWLNAAVLGILLFLLGILWG